MRTFTRIHLCELILQIKKIFLLASESYGKIALTERFLEKVPDVPFQALNNTDSSN